MEIFGVCIKKKALLPSKRRHEEYDKIEQHSFGTQASFEKSSPCARQIRSSVIHTKLIASTCSILQMAKYSETQKLVEPATRLLFKR